MRYLLLLWALIASSAAWAQMANQWINYNQQYLKFPVTQTGVYRINHTLLRARLLNYGVDVNNLNPRNFQLFANGYAIPIHVEGEADGQFDPTDFIEFFASANNAETETALYENGALQGNPYYSLFSDTTWYFFTWNGSTNNARYANTGSGNYAQFSPQPFIFKEIRLAQGNVYIEGPKDSNGKSDPEYKSGEGWHFANYSTNQSRQFTLSTPDAFTGAATATLSFLGMGNSSPTHRMEVRWNNTLLLDTTFGGYPAFLKQYSLSASSLSAGNNTIRFASLPQTPASASDLQAIGYIRLTYPALSNMQNTAEGRFLLAQHGSPIRIQFTNTAGNGALRVYDYSSATRITASNNGTNREIIVNQGLNRDLYFAAESAIKQVTDLQTVGINGRFVDYTSIAPANAFVIITHNRLLQAASDYASFKQSALGGNHFTLIVNVADLYEQFSFGINQNPLAIKHFLAFAFQNFPTPPAHVFLMGKSVAPHLTRKNATNRQDNLVPTLGLPASDLMLVKGLGAQSREVCLPIGRLIALSNNDVNVYLSKVQQFENQKQLPYTTANQDWTKQILHFAGGSNANEQRLLEANLNAYARLLEDTAAYFGGKVTLFSKSSTAPVQGGISQLMRDKINEGVAIMNFFGHSSGSGFDISIDNVASYENDGRYPLVIANSCFIGDLHAPDDSILTKNEEFLLTPNKGAIGFLASVSLGYPSQLHQYTTVLIRRLSKDNYGQSIGSIMKATADELSNFSGSINQRLQNTIYEMSLHGDPSLVIYGHDKPELSIDLNSIRFNPPILSADIDSFEVEIVTTNLGRASNQDFDIEVVRSFSNGIDSINTVKVAAIAYTDTQRLKLPLLPEIAVGENTFKITVDPFPESIDEFDNQNNNQVSLTQFIASDELIPIWPDEYAIVGTDTVVLHSNTANTAATTKTYALQVDVNPNFNSAQLINQMQSAGSGVVSWNLDLSNFADSTVFYWRTAPYHPDSALSNLKWRESSFRKIKSQSGWSQADFAQFNQNQTNFLLANNSQQTFDFSTNTRSFYCRVVGNPPPVQSIYNQYVISLDGNQLDFSICAAVPSIYVVVLDEISLEPWYTRFTNSLGVTENPTHFYNNFNDNGVCGGRSPRAQPRFGFQLNNPAQVTGLMDMLQNQIPDGAHIILHTVMRGLFNNSSIWTPQYQAIMQSLGALNFPSLSDSVPYIFYVQKGNPSSAIETIGSTNNQVLDFNIQLQNNADFGTMQSQLAGPAAQWQACEYDFTAVDGGDAVSVTLFGHHISGEVVPLDTFQSFSLLHDLSAIDAKIYPYLSTKIELRDPSNRSAAQLKELNFYYREVPEYAIDQNAGYYFYNDTLNQGQVLLMVNRIRNLSSVAAEPIKANYLLGKNDLVNPELLQSKTLIPTAQGLWDTIALPTKNLTQGYFIGLQINPKDSTWKIEKHAFNNQISKRFEVIADQENPLLDVTFDGIRILNGDIVSANPEIVIRLKDDNAYLPLNDTSVTKVSMLWPDGTSRTLHFGTFSDYQMDFVPASLPQNEAQVLLRPKFTQDGKYQLKVAATDMSNNQSGTNDFKIDFEVVNKSSITQIMNYPNPFTTATRFVFTLTGSVLPDFMRIQILTVSGKVVREIDLAELGPLNIGRNITTYAWDGTDEFGDRLANGVYLYRVSAKINGRDIETRVSAADSYFTKGFGKMYLFR